MATTDPFFDDELMSGDEPVTNFNEGPGPKKPKKKNMLEPAQSGIQPFNPLPFLNTDPPVKKRLTEMESVLAQYSDLQYGSSTDYVIDISRDENPYATMGALDKQEQNKKALIPVSAKRNQLIKENAVLADEFSLSLFGTPEQIMKDGGGMKSYVTTNKAGQLIVDAGAVSKAIEGKVREEGGGRYAIEHYRRSLMESAQVNLLLYRAAGRIKKQLPQGVSEKDRVAVIAGMRDNLLAKSKAAIDAESQLYTDKVVKLQQQYEPLLADIGMDATFYYKQVQSEVAEQMASEMEGVQGVSPTYINNQYNERVQNDFNARFGSMLEENMQPIVDAYIGQLKNDFVKLQTARKNILTENEKAFEAQKKNYITEVQRKDRVNGIAIQNIVKQELQKEAQLYQKESATYSNVLASLSMMPNIGTSAIGKLFGEGFMSSLGGLKNKAGIMLNGLGFEAGWIDEMKYGGLTTQSTYEMAPIDGNMWFAPGYWGKMIGESAPVMLAGTAATLITRNPYIGALVGTITEGTEIAGGVAERVAIETGDWGAATSAGKEAFIKNVPTYVLEAITSRALLAVLKPGQTAIGAAKNVFTQGVAGGAQEWLQTGGIEMNVGTDKPLSETLFSKEAGEAGVAGFGMEVIMGGSAAVAGGFINALRNPTTIPSARTQVIAANIQRHGEQGAVGAVQMDAMMNGLPDTDMQQGIAEVQRVALALNDGKNMGLTEPQQQAFAGMSVEVQELQEKRSKVQDPVAGEIIDGQIADKKRDMAAVVKGETPLATVELPNGVVFTGMAPKIGEMLQIPELRESVHRGEVKIVSDDAKINKEVEKIQKEEPVVVSGEGQVAKPNALQYDDLTDVLYEAIPNVQGLYGRMLEQLTDPDQQQFIIDAVIDQYNTDFETASARYGESVTKAVEPFVVKSKVEGGKSGVVENVAAIRQETELGAENQQVSEESKPIDLKTQEENQPIGLQTEAQQPYKGRKSNVVYVDGKRLVRAKNGKTIDPETPRGKNALKQHEENYNYNFGEKASEVPANINPEEASRYIAETSSNPAEVAEVFLAEPKQSRFGNKKEEMIAEYGIGKFTDADFAQYDDKNNVTDGIARNYFVGKNNSKAEKIDSYAKELSDHYGIEFTPEDVTSFMKKFPNREFGTQDLSETATVAQQKFEALTGIRLTERVAKLAAAQNLTTGEVKAATNQVNEALNSGVWEVPLNVQQAWMDEEAQFEIDEETTDNIDNLITDYEEGATTTERSDKQQPQAETEDEAGAGEQTGSGAATTVQQDGDRASLKEQGRKEFLNKLYDATTGDFAIYNKLPKDKKKTKLDAISKRVVTAQKDGLITNEDAAEIQQRVNNDYAELGVDTRMEDAVPVADANIPPELLEAFEGDGLDAKITDKAKAKKLSDRIRDMRIANDKLYGGFLGLGVGVYNGFLTTVAAAIDAGKTIGDIIKAGVDYVKANSKLSDKEITEGVTSELQKMGIVPKDKWRSETWYRGVNKNNQDQGDKFYSASEEVATDYAITNVGDNPTMTTLAGKDMPKNPLIVGSKEDLAEQLGVNEDDIYTLGGEFDAKAKAYAQSKGHDAIYYESGSMDEGELHVFGKVPPTPPQEPKEVEDPFERKQGKKSTLGRAVEGDIDVPLKDKIASYGLNYEVQTQADAKATAKQIIADLGITEALRQVRENEFEGANGAEGAQIFAEAIDAVGRKLALASNPDTINQLLDEEAALMDEFDRRNRNPGRWIAMLNDIYKNSDFGYKLSAWVNRYKAANDGEIPAEVEEKYKELDKRYQEVKKRLAELEQAEIDKKANEAIQDIKESVEREKKQNLSYKQKAKKIATALRKGKTNRPGIFMSASPASIAFDAAIEITAKAIEAGGVVADAIKAGVKYIQASEWYKGLSNDKKAEAEKAFEDYAINIAAPVKPKATKENGRLNIPESMIRNYVEQGVEDINELVDLIKQEIANDFPDVTDREIRDAISKYGKTINPTEDAVRETISKLRRMGRYLSALEDIAEQKRPLRSGLQRDKLDAEERAMQKKIRELIKELPMDEETEAKQLKTTLDGIKTRLRNAIEDIEREIETGEKRAANKGGVEYDNEAKQLREQLDALRKVREEIFGKEVTDEQRISRAVAATERASEAIQKKITENDLSFKEGQQLNDPKLTAAKEKLKALRDELNKMRDDAGVSEKRSLEAKIKRVKQQTEMYREKLKNKDFAKKKRKPVVEDSELIKAQAEKIAIQEEYIKEFEKLELKNRTKWQKFLDVAAEIFGVPRVLMATFDLSFMTIQGGAYTISSLLSRKPSLVLTGMRTAFANMKSASKFEAWQKSIKAQDFYPLMKASKLGLSEQDAKLSAREEAGATGYANFIWDWLMLPLKYTNKRLYEKALKANPLKIFERGGVTYMNYLRMMKFMEGATILKAQGRTMNTHPDDYKNLADAINTFTGRASLGSGEAAAKVFSMVLFSPRNWASVIIQTNPILMMYKMNKWSTQDKPLSVAQKMVIVDYMKYIGFTMGVIGMAAAFLNNDDDDETGVIFDPKSSDFLKIRRGDTRVDLFGGRTQMVVFQSRIMLEMLGFNSYEDLQGKESRLGQGLTPTMGTLAWRMLQNKMSPSVGAINEFINTRLKKDGGELKRVNQFGEDYSFTDRAKEMSHPIFLGSIGEIVKDNPDAVGGFLVGVAAIGYGVQVYEQKKKKGKSTFKTGSMKTGNMGGGTFK
jgi:hypothetical protein